MSASALLAPLPPIPASRAGFIDTREARSKAGPVYDILQVRVDRVNKTYGMWTVYEGEPDNERVLLTLPAHMNQADVDTIILAMRILWRDAHGFGAELAWDDGFDTGWESGERSAKRDRDDDAKILAMAERLDAAV